MDQHEPAEKKNYDLERLIFFSDGVFAIVITLLVIELRPPAQWDGTLGGLWRSEWKALLSYALSFLSVGVYWNLHRQIFRRIMRFHAGLVFFNLLLLAFVVLVPFGTQLILNGGSGPLAIYFALLMLVGLSQSLLWAFAAFFADVVEPGLSRAARLGLLMKALGAPVVALFVLIATLSQIQIGWIVLIAVVLGAARRIVSRRVDLRG
ncbi:MAG TPA: TMEM175 family protein [Steroidobacteraceae bacterium]|jgi:uncharacterized membrane protein